MKMALWSFAAPGIILVGLSTTPSLSAQDKSPAAPTKLWAAQTSPTTVTLVWQLVVGAAQYNVFGPRPKSGNAGGGAELLARLGNTASRYVTPLAGTGIAHHYFVQAVDAKGQVSQKAEFNPVVPAAKQAVSSTVPTPTFVKAEVTGPGEVTLRWDAVPGATAYSIGRSVRPQGYGRLCDLCSTEPQYVDHDAVASAVHVYRVSTITPQGTSRPVMSNEVTPATGKESVASGEPAAGVKDALPKAPSGVRATLQTSTSVLLSWIAAGTGATTFQIRRKVGSSAAQLIATVNAAVSSFLDNFGPGFGGMMMTYEVIAVNAKGAAEPVTVSINPDKAATDSAQTPGPIPSASKAPSGLKAGLVSADSVRLTWVPGEAASMYQIVRTAANATRVIVARVAGTVSSYTDQIPPGLQGAVSYWIEATEGKGRSETVALLINPAKARADPLPPKGATTDTSAGKAAVESAPSEDGEVDSLPRVRARTP